jgi:hypothetical protein
MRREMGMIREKKAQRRVKIREREVAVEYLEPFESPKSTCVSPW